MRTIIHYLAAFGLLTLYGGQVCPLIETLEVWHWGALVGVTFGGMILMRALLEPRVVLAVPLYEQPSRQFQLEFFLFGVFGCLLALYNTVHLGFPVHESGPKVVIGFLTFGYFIGLDLALTRERKNGEEIIEKRLSPRKPLATPR